MHDTPSFAKPAGGRYFIKMHGLGNHFVIVDGRHEPYRPDVAEIRHVCDARTGVGADQLIVVEPPTEAGYEGGALAFMRILNVDGREVEACGNATRCVAWLLLEETDCDELILETRAGLLGCRRVGELEVACAMGRVSLDWRAIPLSREVDTRHVDIASGPLADGIALNIGNPHIVYFVDDLDSVDVEAHAPAIQRDALFPEEVNVGVAQFVDGGRLRSKVYERGAGLTSACGSGACVAAYAALARGLTDERRIRVAMPAGEVTIDIDDDGVATMTGPVAYSFAGYL